jgi:hypothetical protein
MDNPAFKNVGRPAYELPNLLKSLGDIGAVERMTSDQGWMVMAAELHATNALATVLEGVETMGRLLTQLGVAGIDVQGPELCKIGDLFRHLAVEAQFLVDVQGDMATILNNDEGLLPEGGAQ